MDQAKLNELAGLPLLPCGAGEKFKAPLNVGTGNPLTGWETMAFTPEQLGAMNGKVICVGTRCGPDAGNLLILDVDGESAEAFCKEQAGSFTGIGWRINRNTDPHRFKLAFRVDDPELLSLLDGVGKIVHTTSQEPREQVELFWATGQCLILGDHRESGGQYQWQGSPLKVKAPPKKWRNLLSDLIHTHKQKSRNPKGATDNWRDAIPCPICGRTDADCRITDDGSFVQCHKGERWHPPELQVGETIQHGTDIWAYVGDGTNAIGECANFKLEKPPFKIVGWDESRKRIVYQHLATGMLADIDGSREKQLLRLAKKGYWEQNFPSTKGSIDWTAAMSHVIEQANLQPIFDGKNRRGRGCHVDQEPNGFKVIVQHMGDRLIVDGVEMPIGNFPTRFVYERKAPVRFNVATEELSTQEGAAILAILKRHGWQHPDDYLHLAGWIVIAAVGGALPFRPQLQITSHFGSGKTDTLDWIISPLLAYQAQYSRGSTEAGLRQVQQSDTLPILVDESEQVDGASRQRAKTLEFCRYAFDGGVMSKGTACGVAQQFATRCSVALAGINAEIPNPADRSRFIVIGRKPIDEAAFKRLLADRSQLFTQELGEKLIRLAVNSVRLLLRNGHSFRDVILQMGITNQRVAEVHGFILSGAYLLTNRNLISPTYALKWLDSIGYPHEPNVFGAVVSSDDESRACLDHLLNFEIRWNERPDDDTPTTGSITVMELMQMVHRNDSRARSAKEALGRHGLAHHLRDGRFYMAVQNSGIPIGKVFTGTKWANKAHVQRLREIQHDEPVVASGGSVHFPVINSQKATLVPWSLIDVRDVR